MSEEEATTIASTSKVVPAPDDNQSSDTTPLNTNSDALSSMTPKEAYFELLRVWVTQANFAHNAQACFPYYLMTNYPQLMAPSPMPFPLMGTPFPVGTIVPPPIAAGQPNLFGLNFGIPPPGVGQPQLPNQQALQRFAMNMFNRNRGRQEDMFDNQARNEESKKFKKLSLERKIFTLIF